MVRLRATGMARAFHLRIARLTGNSETVRHLDRIRFIRWNDRTHRVNTTKGEHLRIMQALTQRDGDRAAAERRLSWKPM